MEGHWEVELITQAVVWKEENLDFVPVSTRVVETVCWMEVLWE